VEETWHVLVSERSQFEKVPSSVIPPVWHYWESWHYRDSKKIGGGLGVGGKDDWLGHRGFLHSVSLLCETGVVDICHYTFGQPIESTSRDYSCTMWPVCNIQNSCDVARYSW
jgi:hypothetical protein